MTTTHFDVPGISCGSCASHIERALVGLVGVTDVQVDITGKHVTVDGTAAEPDLRAALTAAGYAPAE